MKIAPNLHWPSFFWDNFQHGPTALIVVSRRRLLDAVKLLLNRGADSNAVDEVGDDWNAIALLVRFCCTCAALVRTERADACSERWGHANRETTAAAWSLRQPL